MIKHYLTHKPYGKCYLCNQACTITEGKYTRHKILVTCKNCNRILNKLEK